MCREMECHGTVPSARALLRILVGELAGLFGAVEMEASLSVLSTLPMERRPHFPPSLSVLSNMHYVQLRQRHYIAKIFFPKRWSSWTNAKAENLSDHEETQAHYFCILL